jgi:hypothetical protein
VPAGGTCRGASVGEGEDPTGIDRSQPYRSGRGGAGRRRARRTPAFPTGSIILGRVEDPRDRSGSNPDPLAPVGRSARGLWGRNLRRGPTEGCWKHLDSRVDSRLHRLYRLHSDTRPRRLRDHRPQLARRWPARAAQQVRAATPRSGDAPTRPGSTASGLTDRGSGRAPTSSS